MLLKIVFLFGLVGSISSASSYTAKIYTADESWAGTNAIVDIQLFGDKGASGVLKIAYQRSHFEKGSVDTFQLNLGSDIGEVNRIIIGHDNSGIGAGWKLNKVVLKSSTSSHEFIVNKWLDDSSGRTTRVSVQESSMGGASCGKMKASTRVVNGETATKGQWPWQIQMKNSGYHHCGGTLIHPQYVVTASHCVAMSYPNPKNFEIVLGEHDQHKSEGTEQKFKIEKIIVHENYNPRSFDNDIAIIKLDRPAILNDYVNTACLPAQGYHLAGGQTCFITGWGRLYGGGPTGDKLQQAVLPSVDNTECQRVMGSVNPNGGITSNMVCAGGNVKSGCHGDSGGPYVCLRNGKYYLQGAVSWGNPYCRARGFYTVFARVGRYVDWIQNQLEFAKYV